MEIQMIHRKTQYFLRETLKLLNHIEDLCKQKIREARVLRKMNLLNLARTKDKDKI